MSCLKLYVTGFWFKTMNEICMIAPRSVCPSGRPAALSPLTPVFESRLAYIFGYVCTANFGGKNVA